jgi:YD repeat-containing protein
MKQLYQYLFGGLFVLLTTGLLRAQGLPVDLATGAPSVSIPLYTVSNGDVSVPIGLSYSSNGIKVSKDDQVGNAGLGWSLNTGGTIYREVRGLPDDYAGTSTDPRRGWLYSGTTPTEIYNSWWTNDGDANTCTDEDDIYNKLENWYSKGMDTEPDVYYFECGIYAGKFMYDNNRNIKVIPYQDVQISINNGDITVVTGDGHTYNFTHKERTKKKVLLQPGISTVNFFKREYLLYKDELTYTSTWYPSSIVSPTGKAISFFYKNEDTKSDRPVRYATYSSTPTINSEYKIVYTKNTPVLSSITADNVKVDFEWGIQYIDKINVTNGGVGNFYFKYGAIAKSGKGYLRELFINQDICGSSIPYVFDYYGVDFGTQQTLLPKDESIKKDHWGYFNENTKSEVPSIFVDNTYADAKQYRIEPLVQGTAPTYGVTDNSRSSNSASVAAGMLDKVNYPSGGHLRFVYEARNYFDNEAGRDILGGGVRVKKYIYHDSQNYSNDIVKELEYTVNGKSSGVLLYPPVFAIPVGSIVIATVDNQSPEDGLLYSTVKVKVPGSGYTIYEFDIPATHPASGSIVTQVYYARQAVMKPNSDGTYTETCAALGNIKNGTYRYPFPPNEDYSDQRGQLKKVSHYKESSSIPVKEEEYNYVILSHGTIGTTKSLKYDKIGSVFVYGLYNTKNQYSKVLDQHIVRVTSQSDPSKKIVTTTSYTYNGAGDKKLLSQTQVTDGDNVVRTTTIKYVGDYTAISTGPTNPIDIALRRMLNNNMTSIPIETTSKLNGRTTNAVLILYQPLGNYVAPWAKYHMSRNEFTDAYVSNGSFTYDSDYILDAQFLYDPNFKNVVNIDNGKGSVKAFHFGYSQTLPIAEITNAKANQVVYEGFESHGNSGYSFGLTGTSEGGTGERSFSTVENTWYTKIPVKYSGVPQYKFMCRVKTGASFTLNVEVLQDGVRKGFITSPTYSASSDWQLVELNFEVANLTLATNPEDTELELRFMTSTNVLIDDITFFPATASVNTYTYKPGVGQTSATDTRGVTTFYQYDTDGRLTHILDQDKNIRERKSYKLPGQQSFGFIINANFSSSPSSGIRAGQQISFSSRIPVCNNDIGSGLIHKWTIEGPNVSYSASTPHLYDYVFPAAGKYIVKHRVEYANDFSEYQQEYDVKDPLIQISIAITEGTAYTCGFPKFENNTERTFTATVSGCTADLTYKWYAKSSDSFEWVEVGTNSPTYSTTAYLKPYSFKCTVTSSSCDSPHAISNEIEILYEECCDGDTSCN